MVKLILINYLVGGEKICRMGKRCRTIAGSVRNDTIETVRSEKPTGSNIRCRGLMVEHKNNREVTQ